MAKQEKTESILKQEPLLFAKLNEFFPDRVVFHLDKIINCQSPLKCHEYVLSASASSGRKREFIAGRNSLKSSLHSIGSGSSSIGRLKNGAPELPKNIVGSLSHKHPLVLSACAKAVDYTTIGVDIERDTPLKPGAASTFLSENDLVANKSISLQREMLEVVLFCIKESALKALLTWDECKHVPHVYDINVHLKRSNEFVFNASIKWKHIALSGTVILQSPWVVSVVFKRNV